ncbi:MAG: FKBP-type peptidyl-prolyl cis-trans isomerase [Candidatus Amulumruptor caecigallinarius]|nr:FKBP-type peptidyl-prolyl cis-trans isomerase [Candidatus Amulumruptor caecigallinarius]MCM1397671.1 FKBP-type peptidyl-prolyl cis-trans isomerase [Candidatus Amulumruptor caecigallinarius]MCM1454700.1 FKBP-type peptidyl-prolyl cis-trans isomerase [bacterium]
MKKLIIAAGITAVAVTFASCNGSSSKSASEFADSIAEYTGTVQGADLSRSYAQLDSAQKSKMSKDAILAGIKTVLMADTADKGFIVGLGIGQGLLQQASYTEQAGETVSHQKLYEAFAKAFKADSVSGLEADRSTLQSLMMQVQRKAMIAQQKADSIRRAEAANTPEAKKNAADGAAYAAKMKGEGYLSTASGLVYKVNQEGKGESPKDTDVVSVKYTGKHIDGSTFDTSGDRSVDFPVNGVVPGFSEALKMMKPGEKMTVIIPGSLAYGPNGTPDGSIQPNETLVFDIELTGVKSNK